MFSSIALPPSALIGRKRRASVVERDFDALLARIRDRLYPETVPVLASYWLKTVYASAYTFRRWKELNRLLQLALRGPLRDGTSREAITDIQNWIRESVLRTGQAPELSAPQLETARATLSSEQMAAYVIRLLNEWLPIEVARLLVGESETLSPQQEGIPVLAIASALENLLSREHLSPGTLEMLLDSKHLSPEDVYPADLEILRDIVLWLLGRTSAPAPSVMPAALLCVAPQSHLPVEYRDFVRSACLVRQSGGDEVHVPVEPADALEILKTEPVRIGSILVTMDGRSWEPVNLQTGNRQLILYRPCGRLRIDYSEEHAMLRVPWPEDRLNWSGGGASKGMFKIFGREWRAAEWEVDAERTWLRLVFSRFLPIREIAPRPCAGLPRLRPACVDMAWAALERALMGSLEEKGSDSIERLHHSEFVPLGRAVLRLIELVMTRRPACEAIENQLRAIAYLQSPLTSTYGRVPWKLLPEAVRTAFLRARRYPALLILLTEVFADLPEALSQSIKPHTAPSATATHAA